RAWAPPRSFDFPTIIAFLEKLGKFAKDYSALSLTYKGGGVFPIRHYLSSTNIILASCLSPIDKIKPIANVATELAIVSSQFFQLRSASWIGIEFRYYSIA
ncbi:MAG: hypothetical protein AB8G05_19250, partial [Oligoflexales bacterium]